MNFIIMMDPFKTGTTFNRFLVCSPWFRTNWADIGHGLGVKKLK